MAITRFADSDFGVLQFDNEIYRAKEIRFFDSDNNPHPVFINKDGIQVGSTDVVDSITTIEGDITTINTRLDSDEGVLQSLEGRISAVESQADSDVADIRNLRRDADSDSIEIQRLRLEIDSDAARIATLVANADSDAALYTRIGALEVRADSDETKIQSLDTRLGTVESDLDSDSTKLQALQETVDSLSAGQANAALTLTYGHRATLTGPNDHVLNTIDNVQGGLVVPTAGAVSHLTVRTEVTDGAAGGRTVDYKLFVNDSDTGRAVQVSAASTGVKTGNNNITDFTCEAGDEITIKANASAASIKVKAGAVMVRYQES